MSEESSPHQVKTQTPTMSAFSRGLNGFVVPFAMHAESRDKLVEKMRTESR